MPVQAWFAVLAVVMLLGILRSFRWQRSALKPLARPPRQPRYPSLTVIRPIKGLDTGAARNIRAALDHGYRGDVETLFVFDDHTELALPMVKRAIAEREQAGKPTRASVLFCGQPPANRTGKLNAMIVGLRAANHQLIAFVDSDVRQDREALTVLVDTLLAAPDAGAAFAPVVGSEPPETLGDVGYALLLNGLYGPAAAATAREMSHELPFIMGQFMVLRREAIEAIGGLEALQGQLVDDMYLGMRLKAHGYRNRISPHPVQIIQQGMSLSGFAGTYIRWIAFSRSGLPTTSFKLNVWLIGVAFWLGLVASVVAAFKGLLLAAVANALVPLIVSSAVNAMHHRLGGGRLKWRHLWVSAALFVASPAIYASVFVLHEVNWRGRRYQLNAHSRLG